MLLLVESFDLAAQLNTPGLQIALKFELHTF
jgi:hypothetical protein